MSKEDKYKAFLEEIARFISEKRIYTDELRLLAWGTDAGFYRLIPRIVIRSKNEQEISLIMQTACFRQMKVCSSSSSSSSSSYSSFSSPPSSSYSLSSSSSSFSFSPLSLSSSSFCSFSDSPSSSSFSSSSFSNYNCDY